MVVFESEPPKSANAKTLAAWEQFSEQLSKGCMKKVMVNESLSAAISSLS
jgi:hypothetical protein